MPLTFGYQSCLCLCWFFRVMVLPVYSRLIVHPWFQHTSTFILHQGTTWVVHCFSLCWIGVCFCSVILLLQFGLSYLVFLWFHFAFWSCLALLLVFLCALRSAANIALLVPVLVVCAIVGFGGGICITAWSNAATVVFLFGRSLVPVFDNIGVGGGDEIIRDRSTGSNAVSFE